MRYIQKIVASGYLLISLLIGCITYVWHSEWQDIEKLESDNRQIDELRKDINNIQIQLIGFSLFGETVLEWNNDDLIHYHTRRMAMDSMMCRFKATYPAERIDSVRHLLEDKERQMCQIVQVLEQQQAINDKITSQVPVIVQKSVQEQSKKSKRKGFLGIFGKKEETKPTATTTMLRSLNRNMIAEQQAQSRRLSVHADSLAARNAELNRQLQGLIRQIDRKVQADLQKREAEIAAMRERSFFQIGGLTGFVLLLLVISYIIIHRNAVRIKRYKQETTDLIGQLQKSVEQNEALIASRKKAVHTITHELRTPLTAIIGYIALMKKGNNADKKEQYVRNIRQSSERMRKMLNTLLSFFRLDNGKEQPNISPCRISAITHILETEFTPIAMNKGLALTVINQTDTVVLTDKERILQIGNNLLSNAIKFTEEGSVRLEAEYRKGELRLLVQDTGIGMDVKDASRIFDPFERLENGRHASGFGLGLAITSRLVSEMGGKIDVESTPGRGSRFTVLVPLPPADGNSLMENRRPSGSLRLENTRVLLLDDDIRQLGITKEMLRRCHASCDCCTDSRELIARLRENAYDVLLTDIQMPEMDGFSVLELLRSSNIPQARTIPVVALTAHVNKEEEYLARGFAGRIRKPFTIESLSEGVARIIGTPGNRAWKPDFSLILSGEENRREMLDEFARESRKDLHVLHQALESGDRRTVREVLHKNLPLWESVRLDYPLEELRRITTSEPEGWTEKELEQIRDIAEAADRLATFAEQIQDITE